jgi:hypothetical protein
MSEPTAEVIDLHRGNPIISKLQDELYEVINSDRYESVPMGTVIGVLEFLKWNIINGSY